MGITYTLTTPQYVQKVREAVETAYSNRQGEVRGLIVVPMLAYTQEFADMATRLAAFGDRVKCYVCDRPIDPDEDCCTPHEYECPNNGAEEDEHTDCDCELHCHRECCIECQCEADHPKHWGDLWECKACLRKFCFAEGVAESQICDQCHAVSTNPNEI